jgi:hypothetical protein
MSIERTSSGLGIMTLDGPLPRIPSAAENAVRSWDELRRSS